MATKAHHIERPEGLDTLVGLVDLLKNWKRDGEPYIRQLEETIEAYNVRIDAVAKLDEIDALRAQADAALANAIGKAGKLSEEAEKIIIDARVEHDTMMSEAEGTMAVAMQKQRDVDAEIKAMMDGLRVRTVEVSGREAACQQRDERLQAGETDLAKRLKVFLEQQERLRAALPA